MTQNKAIEEIIRFQTDRQLDKMDYLWMNESASTLEELFEQKGYNVPKESRPALKAILHKAERMLQTNPDISHQEPTEHDIVDGVCDEIVFAIGKLLKLGYDPFKALEQAAKEINSRVGTLVEGKFEKDLSPEAKANWYKADFSEAKQKGI